MLRGDTRRNVLTIIRCYVLQYSSHWCQKDSVQVIDCGHSVLRKVTEKSRYCTGSRLSETH